MAISHSIARLTKPVDIAPLAVFRVLFGGIMLVSVLRFALKGWIAEQYIEPQFFFPYYGFEWVQHPGTFGVYALFVLMGLGFLGIMLGYHYKLSATVAFVSFTYVELLDKTNYLNHYYFVSIVCLLLLFVPANRWLSLDALRKPALRATNVPFWTIGIFMAQLGIVYCFAGLAKLNADWLLEAQPLKMWLPARSHFPVVGNLLTEQWVAYAFSWFGAVYDLTIPFLLLSRYTRSWAYAAVVVFHVATWLLFPIGIFPWVMIATTLIFFPAAFHRKWVARIQELLRIERISSESTRAWKPSPIWSRLLLGGLALHLVIQVAVPMRYLAYPGDLFWTEQGYRFSWRVMLMEKAGTAFFYVRDGENGRDVEVTNSDFLTPNQEKMMATQPDMMLQFAHHIEQEYRKQGMTNPQVHVRSYVTLNGSGSQPFLDSSVNLVEQRDSFAPKDWILPFNAPNQLAKR